MFENNDTLEKLKKKNGLIIIYRRLSKEGTKGVALEQQEHDAKQWLKNNGFNLSKEEIRIISDEITGQTDTRPGYQELIRLLPLTKLIISTEVTRISRKLLHLQQFEEERKKAKVEIVFTKLGIASWQNMLYGLMINIFGVLAENEVEIISSRQKASKNQTRSNGRGAFTGGSIPYGFKTKKIQEENSEGKIMTVPYMYNIEEETKIVNIIFNKYKEIRSIDRVAIWCKEHNLKDNKNKDFTRSKITEILRNIDYVIPSKEAYTYFKSVGATINSPKEKWKSKNGIICYNRTTQTNKKENIKHRINQMDEWIISISEKHTGCVSLKLWLECRNIMQSQTTNSGKPHLSNDTSILNGIIYCRDCGNKMYPKLKYPKNENDNMYYHNGDRLFSYRCRMGNNANTIGMCNNRHLIQGNSVDEIVLDALLDMFSVDNNELAKSLKKARDGEFIGNSNLVIDTELKAVQKQLKNYIKEQDNYRKIIENPKTSPLVYENYVQKLEENLNKCNELQIQISKLEEDFKSNYNTMLEVEKIFNTINNLKNDFSNMTIHEKRDAISLLIKEVRIDKTHVDITLIDDNTLELPNHMYCK